MRHRGYSIKLIDDATGIERLACLIAKVHDEGVGAMTRMLAAHHPRAGSIRWLAAIHDASGDAVATLCLIPWTILYDGIEIPAGEMGIVGTRSDHRRLGLMRALVERFDKILAEEGYIMSHIQGIPWFYRQFGYEYTLPLEMKIHLEFRHITGCARSVAFRQAGDDDLKLLDGYYRQTMRAFDLCAARARDEWSYLVGPSMMTDYAADTYIVEAEGETVGYCRVPRKGFGEGLILNECSALPADCYWGFFECLKQKAIIAKKPFIRVNLPQTHPVALAATDLGAESLGGYAWQIKMPDPAAFLSKIAPVLERRLADGAFASYSGTVELDLYRESVAIRLESGRVAGVASGGNGEGARGHASVRMPPNLFAPLVLGQKSFAGCAAFYPDLAAEQKTARLFDVLFPKMNGFFHCPY